MKRRDFLGAACYSAIAAVTSSTRLYAAPASSPRFLLVFLRGGYDCNNLLIPYSSEFYYESRPRISVPAPNVDHEHTSIKLDAEWALCPAVAKSLLPLWEKKQLSFLPFAGTNNLSRSHFETQDSIEAGIVDDDRRSDYNSGFMGRLAEELTDSPAISFTGSLPLIFQGGPDIPNLAVSARTKRGRLNVRQSALLMQMYQGRPQHRAVEEGLALQKELAADQLKEEMDASGQGAPQPEAFERQTRRMARMMADNYRLGFVDVGGWDTHVDQGGATGQLATQLGRLANGLVAFADELGSAEWSKTIVVVLSEFGRTFRENGNRGTDHGHGTVYWILGGSIKGGRIMGEQLPAIQKHLQDDRDYKVLNRYHDFLGTVFSQQWNLAPQSIQEIFGAAHFSPRPQLRI